MNLLLFIVKFTLFFIFLDFIKIECVKNDLSKSNKNKVIKNQESSCINKFKIYFNFNKIMFTKDKMKESNQLNLLIKKSFLK
jgi:hypothetical protein